MNKPLVIPRRRINFPQGTERMTALTWWYDYTFYSFQLRPFHKSIKQICMHSPSAYLRTQELCVLLIIANVRKVRLVYRIKLIWDKNINMLKLIILDYIILVQNDSYDIQ